MNPSGLDMNAVPLRGSPRRNRGAIDSHEVPIDQSLGHECCGGPLARPDLEHSIIRLDIQDPEGPIHARSCMSRSRRLSHLPVSGSGRDRP